MDLAFKLLVVDTTSHVPLKLHLSLSLINLIYRIASQLYATFLETRLVSRLNSE
jgi:hypothetical protein